MKRPELIKYLVVKFCDEKIYNQTFQCSPSIMLCLATIGLDLVINEWCSKGKIYRGIIGK